MTEPALLLALEEAYHETKRSFVRFLVESSEAYVEDDLDRRLYALYDGWSCELERAQGLIGDILLEEGVHPGVSSFPIEFSQFNFLRPTYLLQQVLRKSGEEMERVAAIGRRLEAWPRARDLLEVLLTRQRQFRDRAEKIAAEHPPAAPAPAAPRRIKGTSASRW
ncbi:MAG TPA: hypothetical protein VMT52_07780 [Planctomycetota bacterium]|nr:hypothetical protein [Planctomycetota bacterium]